MKKQEARKHVNSITTSVTLSTALTNIVSSLTKHKISDSFVIAPQQLEMCVKISAVFGFDSFGENTKSILQEQLVTLSSKKLAVLIADKVKYIPKYGKLLAGVINTTVALAMTYALGMAIVEVYAKAYKDYLENEELPNWMELFHRKCF